MQKSTRSKRILGLSVLLLVILAYVVPYVVLSGFDAWYGSFLWWTVTALLTMAIAVVWTRDWGG